MSSRWLSDFDFTPALQLSASERLEQSVRRLRELQDDYVQSVYAVPLIPDRGATEQELVQLEEKLGTALPGEYRLFLGRWRYLIITDGFQIWGFGWHGESYGEPYVSTDHQPGEPHLIIGNHWELADGDELMIPLENPTSPVIAYLHDCGPALEIFAPSFSLAIWRWAWS